MHRILPLLGLLLLGAAAAPAEALPALDDALRALEPHRILTKDAAPSLGDALQRGVGIDPVVPAAPGPASTGAGPAPPAQVAAAAGRELLHALLAFGGAATLVALGWRHLHRRNVLDHPGRAAMLALVRAHPGLHLRALARAAGLPVQVASYHLRVLESMGLVRSHGAAGRLRFHEAGVGPEVRRALAEAAVAPSESAKQVLAFVLAHPGASQSEVARALAMLPGRARWHLRRLTEQGALAERRDGRALRYRAADPEPGPSTGPGR